VKLQTDKETDRQTNAG